MKLRSEASSGAPLGLRILFISGAAFALLITINLARLLWQPVRARQHQELADQIDEIAGNMLLQLRTPQDVLPVSVAQRIDRICYLYHSSTGEFQGSVSRIPSAVSLWRAMDEKMTSACALRRNAQVAPVSQHAVIESSFQTMTAGAMADMRMVAAEVRTASAESFRFERRGRIAELAIFWLFSIGACLAVLPWLRKPATRTSIATRPPVAEKPVAPIVPKRPAPAPAEGVLGLASPTPVPQKPVSGSEEFGEEILRQAPLALILFDRDGSILRWSRSAEEMTEFAAAEIRGTPFWDLFLPPNCAREGAAEFEAYLRGESLDFTQQVWVTRTGQHRVIRWWRTILRNELGQPVRVIACGVQSEELPITDSRWKQVARASNDFLNELTLVGGFSEYLAVSLDPNHPMRPDLERIQHASVRATQLAREIYELTQLGPKSAESNPITLERGQS